MIQRINLIPLEFQPRKISVKLPVKYFVVIALGLLYILPMNSRINSQIKKADEAKLALESKKLELVTRNMNYVNLLESIESREKTLSILENKSAILRDVVKTRIFWSDILKEISFIIPDNLWLNEIFSNTLITNTDDDDNKETETVEKKIKEVKIRGSSYNNKVITEFVEKLEHSYFLNEVRLRYTEKRVIKDKYIVYDFEVAAQLKEFN